MSNVKVKEAGTSLGKVNGKKRWRSRIIAVGSGSSGVYTEEALRETGPAAFPVGTQVHINHDSWRDEDERPEGDLRRLAGVLVTDAAFEDDGLYAEIEFGQEWAPFVEEFHEFIGLSIAASGYGSETNEMGLPIIEGLIPSPLNRVDLVTKAGAKGKVIEALESFRDKIDVNERKEKGMKPEEIKELAEAIVAGLAPSFAELKEALTPVEVEEDETEEGEDIATIAEAVAKAELPEIARNKVYLAVKEGAKVDDAIKEQTDYIKALSEASDNSGFVGKVKESTPVTPSGPIKIAGW